MVRDNVGRHWIHKNYCNAGMILFDVDRTIKSKDKIIKAREMIRTVKMFMPDQTAINRAFKMILNSCLLSIMNKIRWKRYIGKTLLWCFKVLPLYACH